MAQKFANFRWVGEGYLDDRHNGIVVGRIRFAGIGWVDMGLVGGCTGDLAGKVFRFRNSKFVDDAGALDTLAEFESPHTGTVSLISFDPHPLLEPHPYIEWFSPSGRHYRIELHTDDAVILTEDEITALDEELQSLHAQFAHIVP